MSRNQTAASMGGARGRGATTPAVRARDHEYEVLLHLVGQRVAHAELPLLVAKVNRERLWRAFIGAVRKTSRQHYTCHACRRFIQTYGALVYVEQGRTRSLLWDKANVPGMFKKAFAALRAMVERAQVEGVFVTDQTLWGVCGNDNGWRHLSGLYRHAWVGRKLTASQRQAELLEDYKMLRRVLRKYSKATVHEAVRVLEAGVMAGSEKALGNAQWLLDLYGRKAPHLWVAVAQAPAGWCHVSSGMLSTLLDDIAGGKTFSQIKRAWEGKMHPLQYRRPQAPPKAGTIGQAERQVAAMGVERSLARRYATLDDVRSKLWVPRQPRPKVTYRPGVFGHLQAAATKPHVQLPDQAMTAQRFIKDVLPRASKLEVSLVQGGNYYGLTTARHADAPNILQWDNPVGWYVYVNGSDPQHWGLVPGWLRGGRHWGEVTAVFFPPYMWSDTQAHPNQCRRLLFALKGARDVHDATGCLFPSMLHSDFHSIRSVIEAHSRSQGLTGKHAGNANGIAFDDGPNPTPLTIRVDGQATYKLDRWR